MVSTSISSLIHNDDLPVPETARADVANESHAQPAAQLEAPSVPLKDMVLRFQVPHSMAPDASLKASAVHSLVHQIILKDIIEPTIPKVNSTLPALVVSDYMKRFRTDFRPFPDSTCSELAVVPITASRSGKNSVKLLLNADESPARTPSNTKPAAATISAAAASTPQSAATTPKKRAPAKRKPADSKLESVKRSKTDLAAASIVGTDPSLNDLNKLTASDLDKKLSSRPLSEGKKVSRSNKKQADPITNDPETAATPLQKPVLSHLSTTEMAPVAVTPALPSPSVIESVSSRPKPVKAKDDSGQNPKRDDEKSSEPKLNTTDTTEKAPDVPPPIIALSIPLLDPANYKPGKAEVIVNVLKLIEDKYGWLAVHPKATSALEMMDDLIDEDEDDNENDEENDTEMVQEDKSTPQNPKRKKEGKELTEEQLVRQHESRMNRKVGKYDYEDPFIDDEELQMEEEIASTKEGFFVYWGPLVDDRNSTSKKGSVKTKK